MSKQRLNDCSGETIEKNFLEEEMDIPVNEVVHPHCASQPIPKMEEIIFINNRDPGVTLHFHYASKTHPLRLYDLIHGQKYTLQEEVIQHLEGTNPFDPWACHQRLYGVQTMSDGTVKPCVTGYKSNFQCKPVRRAA